MNNDKTVKPESELSHSYKKNKKQIEFNLQISKALVKVSVPLQSEVTKMSSCYVTMQRAMSKVQTWVRRMEHKIQMKKSGIKLT